MPKKKEPICPLGRTPEAIERERGQISDIHKRIVYLMEEMPVNGSKGIESVLRTHHESIKELHTLTAGQRAQRDFRRDVVNMIKTHPVRSVFLILAIVGAYLGHGELVHLTSKLLSFFGI